MQIQRNVRTKTRVLTESPQETLKLGKNFARMLKGGEVIGLTGELGSGKTVFAKGVASGLGAKTKVISPSFMLMKSYQIKRPKIDQLLHFDLYRIRGPKELAEVGFSEALSDKQSVALVEWPEKSGALFPKGALEISFRPGKTPSQRIIEFKSWTKNRS